MNFFMSGFADTAEFSVPLLAWPVRRVTGEAAMPDASSPTAAGFDSVPAPSPLRRFVLYHYNGLEDPGRKPACVAVHVSQIDDASGSGGF